MIISLLGLPNSGKSTLINAISNQKVSITDSTPNTTRDYVSTNKFLKREQLYVKHYFPTIENVNMYEIKQHYILVLQNIMPDKWSGIYEYFNSSLYNINLHRSVSM